MSRLSPADRPDPADPAARSRRRARRKAAGPVAVERTTQDAVGRNSVLIMPSSLFWNVL